MDLNPEDIRFAAMIADGLRCRSCRMAEPAFVQAVSYGTYTGELRLLVHLFKFSRQQRLARRLGGRLAEAMLRLTSARKQTSLVVAVPLYLSRQRQRGFNQSSLLADEAVRQLQTLAPDWSLERGDAVLKRQRQTAEQWALSAKGRRRNLRGAFVASPEVAGRTILLIDDIMTTGATVNECARALLHAGASAVYVATLARSQHASVLRKRARPEDRVARWDLPPQGTVKNMQTT